MLSKPFQDDHHGSSASKDKDSMQMTTLPMEYTEFNGQQLIESTGNQIPPFNQSSIVKPRRSRKDRARGGANSKSGTTSSSGINMGGGATSANISSSLYEYNSNQLTAQYGNSQQPNAGRSGANYAEDLELGMGGGTNNFSINNYNLSD